MYNTVNKKYRMSFYFGNNTSHQRYSKRVVKISVNEPAFSIIFIPQYNLEKHPFPPYKDNFEYVGEKFYKSDRRRILGFQENQIIFFEHDDKCGETYKIQYNYKCLGEDCNDHHLIICINSEQYNKVIKELKADFYYSPNEAQSTVNGAWKHDILIRSEAVQFIDKRLKELKDDLPESVKESLEM